jgi:hypothetical protein
VLSRGKQHATSRSELEWRQPLIGLSCTDTRRPTAVLLLCLSLHRCVVGEREPRASNNLSVSCGLCSSVPDPSERNCPTASQRPRRSACPQLRRQDVSPSVLPTAVVPSLPPDRCLSLPLPNELCSRFHAQGGAATGRRGTRAGTEAQTDGACMPMRFHRLSNVCPLYACEPLPSSCRCVPPIGLPQDSGRAATERQAGGRKRTAEQRTRKRRCTLLCSNRFHSRNPSFRLAQPSCLLCTDGRGGRHRHAAAVLRKGSTVHSVTPRIGMMPTAATMCACLLFAVCT